MVATISLCSPVQGKSGCICLTRPATQVRAILEMGYTLTNTKLFAQVHGQSGCIGLLDRCLEFATQGWGTNYCPIVQITLLYHNCSTSHCVIVNDHLVQFFQLFQVVLDQIYHFLGLGGKRVAQCNSFLSILSDMMEIRIPCFYPHC